MQYRGKYFARLIEQKKARDSGLFLFDPAITLVRLRDHF
jgi:hypothetical protein